MATTSRRSRPAATPTRTPVRIPARTQPRALPSYQPPSAPLNARAIQSLNTLPTKQDLAGLKSHGRKAPERLTEAVADINEQLLVRREDLAKARARADRAAEQGDGEDGAERREWAAGEEAQARVMEDAVKELTGKIEEAVRAGIDAQARVEAGERAIEQVASQVARGEGRLEAGATQSTLGASQFRSGRLEDGDDGEAGSQGGGMGAMALLQLKAQEFEAEYARQSMRMRYASHNDYASFKKSLHQAQHSGRDEAAPPLPHARTWFPSENGDDDVSDTADRDATGAQSSRRGTSKRAGRAAAADPIQDDSESDVETTAVNVNIKCPLTLLPMKDPVTSTKCPHSFEREAILDMMKHTGSMRPRGTPQLNAMKCPCCEVTLHPGDLHPDPVLRRNIARILARRQQPQGSDSDSEDDIRGTMPSARRQQRKTTEDASAGTKVKEERNNREARSVRGSVVPGTQIADLEEQNENEDEDEEAGDGDAAQESGGPFEDDEDEDMED